MPDDNIPPTASLVYGIFNGITPVPMVAADPVTKMVTDAVEEAVLRVAGEHEATWPED